MRDEDKTKEQLITELIELRREIGRLRQRITQLETSEVDHTRQVTQLGGILIEMGCLAPSQLQRALQRQKEEDVLRHQLLGQVMIAQGLITREERDSALDEQKRRKLRRSLK